MKTAPTSSPPRVLLIDNYDSFTYNLYDYLLQLGATCTVVRNDEWTLAAFLTFPCDAIVLSPGPQSPQEAGLLLPLIELFHRRQPSLGICLGHQGLGQFLGARLRRADLPMHGKTSRIRHRGHPLFAGLPEEFSVMRYHSLLIDQLEGSGLESIAETEAGEIMAMAHREWPLVGVQFHPESILTEYGLDLLRNWLATVPRPQNSAKI